MFLVGIRTFYDQLRRRVAVDGIVHLVLHRLEEQAGRLCVFVVIKRSGVQIRHFLIEFAFRQTNLPNLLQLPLEILIGEHMTLFQAVNIHRPALNGVVFDDLPRPLAELHSPLVVHLETNGNDCLQAIMVRIIVFPVCGSY